MKSNLPRVSICLVFFIHCFCWSYTQDRVDITLEKQKDSLVSSIRSVNMKLLELQAEKEKAIKELDIVISKIQLQELDIIRTKGAMRIINISTCRVRKEPSILSSEIMTLTAKDTIFVYEAKEDYFKIRFKNQVGYINKVCILKEENATQISQPLQFAGNNAKENLIDNNKSIVILSTDCNSSQCNGLTKKNRRCRNMTTNCSGRCYLH
jgi:hypothetical protein